MANLSWLLMVKISTFNEISPMIFAKTQQWTINGVLYGAINHPPNGWPHSMMTSVASATRTLLCSACSSSASAASKRSGSLAPRDLAILGWKNLYIILYIYMYVCMCIYICVCVSPNKIRLKGFGDIVWASLAARHNFWAYGRIFVREGWLTRPKPRIRSVNSRNRIYNSYTLQ